MVKPTQTQPWSATKNYYQRPTLASILFEESPTITTMVNSGKTIYEWNIDGWTNYQIITTLHNILMYATICRTSNNTNQQITEFLTARFFGQLKGWDHHLIPIQKHEILHVVKIEPLTQQPAKDSVYTLI